MNHRRYTYLVGEDILLLKRRYTSFLKETHRLFMHGGMGALLLWLLTLTACVGEELQKPLLGEGEGYLTLQIGAISAEVTSDPLTKATISTPAVDDLTINIKQSNGASVDGFPMLYANLPDLLVLKAGVTYTVAASYGTDEALQESPYFYGSDSIYIQANTNNQVSLAPSLANAMIIPVVTDSLKRHYNDDWTLTASTNNTTKPFPLTFTNGTCTFYAKAGETVSLNFKGTNKAGEKADATWKSISNVEACKAYTVQCNPNLTAFENIQVTATAKHTYDNGYLTGTAVELNSNLMEANKEAIKEWNVAIKYKGQIIRSYSGSAPNNLEMTKTNEWPYIPQSSELFASVTLISGDVIAVGRTFAVPAPDFGVAVSAYTSYDKYVGEDITAANNCQPETMYDIQASAKIATELLNNSNYTHTFRLLLDDENEIGSSSTSTTINVEKKEGLSWAAHTLKAVMTFAGSECSKDSVYHITGLPYTLKHPANSGEHPWYIVQSEIIKFTDTYIFLTTLSPEPTVGSSAFHIPDNTLDFQLNCGYHKNTSSWGEYTFYVELLNPTDNNRNGTICSHKSNKKGDYTLSGNGTFSTSYPAISCRYGYIANGNDCNVNSISINYR